MRFLSVFMLIALDVLISGCSGGIRDEEPLKIDAKHSLAAEAPIEAQTFSGQASYESSLVKRGPKPEAHWLACSAGKDRPTALIMHRERIAFDPALFCKSWIAQTFLHHGFNVITVHRPGYGQSTPPADLIGDASLLAIRAGVDQAVSKNPEIKKPTGAWGYGFGASVAALYARKYRDLSWLVLGGGFYDLEATYSTTQDASIKSLLETTKKIFGDAALEPRSAAYDLEGYPKHMAIYHGKLDTTAPYEQGHAFKDSLAANEIGGTMNSLDGASHDLPADLHHQVLTQLLASVPK